MPADIFPPLLDALSRTGAAGLLAGVPENVSYLADAALPFPRHLRPERPALAYLGRDGRRLLALPFDWAQAVTDQGYDGEIAAYDENAGPGYPAAARAMAQALAGRGLTAGPLLTDLEDAPAALGEAVTAALPGCELRPDSAWFAARRLVKTPGELERIETAANSAARGFIGAINHLEGTTGILPYTLVEVGERVRVHAIEFDASSVGHLAVLQGADGAHEYLPARGVIQPGMLVRLECSVGYLGYWTRAACMLSIGQPAPEQARAYQDNQTVKAAALAALRVGAKAGDVYAAAAEAARQAGIDFCGERGVGHGVGRSEAEAPWLVPGSDELLPAGAAVVLDVVTRAPSGELIRSMDTYALEENGPRLLSWLKPWNRLYAITGFRSTH